MIDRFESKIGSALTLRLCTNQIEIFVPAKAQIQSEIPSCFPIILEIEPEHFSATRQIEIRIASSRCHATHQARCREALWRRREDDARQLHKVDLQRRIELEKASKLGFPKIVHTSSESMVPSVN